MEPFAGVDDVSLLWLVWRHAAGNAGHGTRPKSGRAMSSETYILLDALRVGIVDDNAYFRRILRTMLAGFGIRQLYEGATVAEGWDIVNSHVPDILIADWVLGRGEPGSVLLDRMRTSSDIRVATRAFVFLSAYSDKRHVLTAAKLGANDFIVKPVSARQLYDRLRRVTLANVKYVRRSGRVQPVPGGQQPPRRGFEVGPGPAPTPVKPPSADDNSVLYL